MSDNLPLVLDLTLPQLQTALEGLDAPGYRAKQLWQGIYRQFWENASEFTNFPKAFREELAEKFRFSALEPIQTLVSADKETVKTLFRLPDGKPVEAVMMKYDQRRTLCISTQSGCAMGCVFCATGQMGFQRNLTSGEIIEQVLFYARMLRESGEQVTNIVIMGMGEPFHNYDATMSAIDRLNHPDGMNLGERRFTISTVGLVPAIQRFTADKRQINLAISLHAANDQKRSALLPINRRYPLTTLIPACREYVEHTHRRITFEWALIEGSNDRSEDAVELANLLKGLLCHVNVIPLNPTKNFDGKATSRSGALAFKEALEAKGIPCTIRLRRGIEISAGCGQLAAPMVNGFGSSVTRV
ncbi:MAG TPA: 23S rRNA (adenine(2503)-C(2))-methyltransferase RlmN [Anaerolineaceae bacterium]